MVELEQGIIVPGNWLVKGKKEKFMNSQQKKHLTPHGMKYSIQGRDPIPPALSFTS